MELLHKLSKEFKPYRTSKHLVAVSGGMDSMALLEIFLHLRNHFKVQFSVVHFHHGPTTDSQQMDYRFNAYELVKKKCEDKKIDFFCNFDGLKRAAFLKNFSKNHPLFKNPEAVIQNHSNQSRLAHSESEFRQLRYRFMKMIMEQNQFDFLSLAHHRDDLLETRLMRLIRGVGPQGLPSMKKRNGALLRPLLNVSRQDLRTYLLNSKSSWLDDPSNENQKPFRNWIRKKWLKDLEIFQPGAIKGLARSLDLLLVVQKKQIQFESCFESRSLVLSEWLCLDSDRRRLVIANYMKSQGLKNYGLSHINELLKRLDTEKKHHTFSLAGGHWTVDAGRLNVQRLGHLSEEH